MSTANTAQIRNSTEPYSGLLGDGMLADITCRRLFQFRDRRHRLARWRGLAITATLFAVTLLAATILDAIVDHSVARWMGSILVYVITLLSTWFLCIRPFLGPLELTSEASQFEASEPRLREQLLAAVELSDSGNSNDSPAFRSKLQERVAEEIAPVDVRHVLPWQQIQRFLVVGFAAIMILGLLCCIPSLRLPHRIARTLLPGADLGRVSRVAINLVTPMPHSKVVPLAEVVAVSARVDGPEPEFVWLETRTERSEDASNMVRQSTSIGSNAARNAGNARQYQTTVAVQNEWLEYRVTAEGAYSPWYRLTTKPRPQATAFEKRISLPAYALVDPVITCDEHGNVEALKGSHVQIAVQVNQPVSLAELRWDTQDVGPNHTATGAPKATRLVWDGERKRLVGEFPIETSTSYRLFLQSTETGFTNAFSPKYHVTALEDAAPTVHWTKPQTASMISGPAEILAMGASVSDEVLVEKTVQFERVNSGEWHETELARVLETEDKYQWQFDLLKRDVHPGDSLETKIVAHDVQGNIGESAVLKIFVSTATMQLTASAAEESRLELAGALETFSKGISVSAGSMVASQTENNAEQTPDRAGNLAQSGEDLSEQLRAEIPKLIEQVTQAAHLQKNPVSAMELRLAGELLAQLLTRETSQLSVFSDAADTSADLAKLAKKIESQATGLAEHMRAMVTHDIVSRHSNQLTRLADAGRDLSDDSIASADQLRRRQQVLARQTSDVQQAMRDSLGSARLKTRNRLVDVIGHLGNLIDQTERQLQTGANSDILRNLAERNADSLAAVKRPSHLDGSLSGAISKAHRWLDQQVDSPHGNLQTLSKAIAKHALHAEQLDNAVRQLSLRRSILRASDSGDRSFASDLGNARRALESIVATSDSDRIQSEKIRSISEPLKTLEAANELSTAGTHLAALLQSERWNLDSNDSATEIPRIWDAFAGRIEHAAKLARNAGPIRSMADRIDRLRWDTPAQTASQRILSRRWESQPPISAANPIEALSQSMNSIRNDMLPLVEQARAQLLAVSPTIAALATKAATETEQLSQQTRALASEFERDEVPDASIRMSQLDNQLDELDEPFRNLREALVDQADAQDLLDFQDLNLARRADKAIDVVDHADQQAHESLAGLPQSKDQRTQSKALAQASQEQAEAASALEELANLFDESKKSGAISPEALGEQLASLNRLSKQLGEQNPARDTAAEYDQAERLARLAATEPQQVLRELEKQLKTNEPMQHEMSDIAKTTAKQALAELEHATEQQSTIQPALESSDPVFQARKKLLLHDLATSHRMTLQMLDLLVAEAKWSAGAAKEPEDVRTLTETESRLRTALERSVVKDEQQPYSQLQTRAFELHNALADAHDQLTTSAQRLNKASEKEIHASAADASRKRREMKDRARRTQQQDVRNAQQAGRAQQQRLKQADNELRSAQQREKAKEKALQQMRNRLEKQPEQEWLKPQIAENQQQLALARALVAAEQVAQREVKNRVDRTAQALKEINAHEPSPLESSNPSAELASLVSGLAAERSKKIAETLGVWKSRDRVTVEASKQRLNENLVRQDSIQSEVTDAADQLARASRHESRLGNEPTSGELEAFASQVDAVGQNEVQQSRDLLASAAENAGSGESTTGQASATATTAAIEASAESETAIRDSAIALRTLLDGPSESGNTSNSPGDTSRSEHTPSDPMLDSKQMAQLLDELDRQLNGGKESSNSGQNGQSKQSASEGDDTAPGQPGQPGTSPSEPGVPSTLSQAANQLAAQMGRQRKQAANESESDSGKATESGIANVDPQGPVRVRIIDVPRIDGQWGQLQEQRAEGAIETRRDILAPRYRQQVEAYFRNLSIQSHPSQPIGK